VINNFPRKWRQWRLINGTAEMLWETRRLSKEKVWQRDSPRDVIAATAKFQNSNNTLCAFFPAALSYYYKIKISANLMIVSFSFQAVETRNLVQKLEQAETRESLKEEVKVFGASTNIRH
jgi:hypothetical protein